MRKQIVTIFVGVIFAHHAPNRQIINKKLIPILFTHFIFL